MAANYTNREYAEMLVLYGECDRNAEAAAAAFGRVHDRQPSGNVVRNLVRRVFDDDRPLMPQRGGGIDGGRPRTARDPDTEVEVLRRFRADPSTSISRVARAIGKSRSTVNRILKEDGQHAFHIQRVQKLKHNDFAARRQFCRRMLQAIEADPDFVNKILFTDESTFGRLGTWNTHNYHKWARRNPKATAQVRSVQTRFGVNLWTGIVGNHIVSTYAHQS